MPLAAKILPMARHLVAATIVPGAHAFELAVACEVFGLDRSELGVDWYDFRVCAVDPPVDLGGFTLDTPYGMDDLADADTVIVPACPPDAGPPAVLVDALRAAYERGARIVSYCSGAFALAAAGILDDRPSTTHWMYSERLAREYPLIKVRPDVLYVDDGQVLTSAGTSAAIDVSLHIVRCDYGTEIANAVARRMVIPPHRDGGQAQFVDQPVPTRDEAYALGPTLDWVVDHLSECITVEDMAAHALMSSRTFVRRFRAATGTTPLRWLLQQRIAHARRLLEDTDIPIEQVAQACGFGTGAGLRMHFQRSVSTTPTTYRRTFRDRPDRAGVDSSS